MKTIVLMTALLPTTGHTDLIDFAFSIGGQTTCVIVNGRSFEPISLDKRIESLREYFRFIDNGLEFIADLDDMAPQNPDPNLEYDEEFWAYWKKKIESLIGWVDPKDVIVASEEYGAMLAYCLGCRFVPYDISRELNPTKGTDVRNDISGNWNKIIPTFKHNLKMNVVIFGQESVGKTTLAKDLVKYIGRTGYKYIHEYARPYLECKAIGTDVTPEKMDDIARGQAAIEFKAIYRTPESQVNIFDTDLLSTIGYNRIFKNSVVDEALEESFKDLKDQKLYILLPDDVPFEADPLRYGGDKRESTYEFWRDLLDEYQCNYIEMPRNLSKNDRFWFAYAVIYSRMQEKYKPIKEFKRD